MSEIDQKCEKIDHLNDLIAFEGKDVTILLRFDKSVRMATVSVDDVVVMTGTFDDFYPGCHGGWHYDLANETFGYLTPRGMAKALQAALISRGAMSVVVEELEYDWNKYSSAKPYQKSQ
jgi:hypothetical protein